MVFLKIYRKPQIFGRNMLHNLLYIFLLIDL
jgi:hypothetical protein